MINTSTEYIQALLDKRQFSAKATCILKDGTQLDLSRSNFFSGGVAISDGVSGSNQFDIGTAIVNQLTLVIDNSDESFSDYNFTDAQITVFVGMQLTDRIEWLKKGVFTSSDPTATPAVLTLKALDNMSKFDKAYDGNLSFPANLQTIVQYCCSKCGVLLLNGQFPNYAYEIQKNPFDGDSGNVTYRALISYCALLAGCYARCNADGRLELKWYDTAAFDNIIDGGVFDKTTEVSYQTGDTLDGGNFTDYASGDTADGGTFTEVLPYHHIYSFSSLSVSTEDVVITGIRVTASDSENSAGKKLEGETYLCGAEGYILEVSKNPLIEYGQAKTVAEYLASRIVGMRFRPFNASCVGDPSMEAGDAAILTDRKGNSYSTYITNLTYSVGSYASISCDAEPAARHSTDRYSQIEQIVADIKNDSQQKLSSYAEYVNQMNQLAINAMGYYETNEPQDDGSVINYMHDKPLLSESTIVYKKSIDGFFISRDGGQSYVGGMDKDSNIVANTIAAIGISFDWAKGGTLTLGGDSDVNGILLIRNAFGTEVVRGDKDGIAVLKGSISGTTITGSEIISSTENRDKEIKMNDGTLTFYYNGGVIGEITPALSILDKKMGIVITPEILDAEGNTQDTFISFGLLTFDANTADSYPLYTNGNFKVYGSFTVTGPKSRVVDTPNYSERLLYCYEMPSPMFGDIGEGCTDEKGECYISIDDIFTETVNHDIEYQVFLQRENPGDLWVADKQKAYFVVKGTPNLTFAWEIKVKQRDYEYERLELIDNLNASNSLDKIDYEVQYIKEMKELVTEQEALFYETA